MYVSPNHPDPPRAAAPPEDDGQELATIPRKEGEQLRIRLKEFRGSRFVWIQPWSPGADGRLWPIRGKGVSLRLGELADVVNALHRVDELVGQDDGRPVRGYNGGDQGTPYR